MINYLFNEEHHKELLRKAANERLVRIASSQTPHHGYFRRLRMLWEWRKENPVQNRVAPTPVINVPCNCTS